MSWPTPGVLMPEISRHINCKSMKRNLFQALENADAEMSAKNQVKIDSRLMSHISGGKSSGNVCTISGECNESGKSCQGYWDTLMALLDSIERFCRDTR